MVSSTSGRQCGVRGFTYIGVLIVVAVMTAGLGAAGQLWHTTVQRAREAQLIFVGEEFKQALERYYDNSPATAKQFPETLDELTLDARHPVVVRHLRQIYRDPITGRAEWGLVKREQRIVGIFSLSDAVPFAKRYAAHDESPQKYSDWRFLADFPR